MKDKNGFNNNMTHLDLQVHANTDSSETFCRFPFIVGVL